MDHRTLPSPAEGLTPPSITCKPLQRDAPSFISHDPVGGWRKGGQRCERRDHTEYYDLLLSPLALSSSVFERWTGALACVCVCVCVRAHMCKTERKRRRRRRRSLIMGSVCEIVAKREIVWEGCQLEPAEKAVEGSFSHESLTRSHTTKYLILQQHK